MTEDRKGETNRKIVSERFGKEGVRLSVEELATLTESGHRRAVSEIGQYLVNQAKKQGHDSLFEKHAGS